MSESGNRIGAWILGGQRRVKAPLERASRPLRGIWPHFPDAVLALFSLGILALALLTYSTTLSYRASTLLSSNKYLALANGMLNPFRNHHVLLKSGLPVYDLKIDRDQYAIIEKTVEDARKRGWMDEELKVWADGQFISEGEKYNVKVRIRGDLSPHWAGPKKSWRIKFGKEVIEEGGTAQKFPRTFQGKRQINLIIPSDREYVLSHFVNNLLREQGLVTPRDQFVVLRINGILQGLYYEVEHFDKPLLAASRRPETPVFGQNDRAMNFEQYTKYGTPLASDARFDLGSVRLQVEQEGFSALRAMQVLIDHSVNPTPENFRRVRAVLDWEKYLRFRVLTTLFNTNHVRFGSDNLKLYFDESRGLLEPIPWDLHLARMPKEPGTIDFWNSHGPDEIQRATLMDPELRLQRNKILWELVADGGKSLIARFDGFHERIRPLAWADVLTTPIQGHKMDALRGTLVYNVRRVHKVLSHSSANATYRLQGRDRAALDITVANFSGIEVGGIEISDPRVFEGTYRIYEDANLNDRLDADDPFIAEVGSEGGTVRFNLNRRLLPRVKYASDFIKVETEKGTQAGQYWEFFDTLAGRSRFILVGRLAPAKRHPLEWTPPEIRVSAVNAVTGTPLVSGSLSETEGVPDGTIAVLAFDASPVFDLEAPERSVAEFLEAHPQFVASRERPGAVELRGQVTISGTIIVPKSVLLILTPGTEVTMMPDVSILGYGGLRAAGTSKAPIRIHDSGKGEPWGVFAVVRPPERVVLKDIEVQGGGQARINGILFTGGVAVHEGDLQIENCRIFDMQSEDGLNLKNGDIFMRDCLFAGNASDGVDLDFVSGEVRDSTFAGNKGDGLDLSGSTVTIGGSTFENSGDKGISVGEASHPTIVNNLIRRNVIGLSTKDLSRAKVAYCTFEENGIAIEAKRKKPMFGGGGGDFVDNVFSRNKVVLEDDYFSKGLVVLRSSLLDRPDTACKDCLSSPVRFVSTDAGDYQLAPGIVEGKRFVMVRPDWAGSVLSSSGFVPQQPGFFGRRREASEQFRPGH